MGDTLGPMALSLAWMVLLGLTGLQSFPYFPLESRPAPNAFSGGLLWGHVDFIWGLQALYFHYSREEEQRVRLDRQLASGAVNLDACSTHVLGLGYTPVAWHFPFLRDAGRHGRPPSIPLFFPGL